MLFLGTLVNVGTILLGALVGFLLSKLFSKSQRLAAIPDAAMKAVSLVVIFIGIKGAFESKKTLVVLLSLLIGSVIGTIINIDGLLERLGAFLERKFVRNKPTLTGIEELDEGKSQKSISRAFVSTTLTCLVGAMSILGALRSGLSGGSDQELLFTKSILDFITAMVFSSAFGAIGAALAVVPVLLYQGSTELLANAVSGLLSNSINEISATGSLIVMALGLNMLGATKIKVANLLPAILLPILLCLFM